MTDISGPGRAPFLPSTTLLGLPAAANLEGIEIAAFGLPFDGGSTARRGAALGPDDVRRNSFNVHPENWATRIRPSSLCRAADIGDSPIDIYDPVRSLALISDHCRAVTAAGARPLAVGGDHTISLAMLRGLAARHGPVAVIHFDAHPDCWDDASGNRYNHGTPFRRAVEEELEDPTKHVMIGLRGTGNDPEAFDWAAAQGIKLLDMDACDDLGPAGIAASCRDLIGDHPTYITIDVDALDPAEMPGTGSPEPGGLTMREAQRILRGLRGMNIVGADVNEVAPTYDPSGRTGLNAAHLLFELLCLMAEHHQRHKQADRRA